MVETTVRVAARPVPAAKMVPRVVARLIPAALAKVARVARPVPEALAKASSRLCLGLLRRIFLQRSHPRLRQPVHTLWVRPVFPLVLLQVHPLLCQPVCRLLPHHPFLVPVRLLHLQINLACHLLQCHLSQVRLLALVPVLGLLSPKCQADPHLQHQASRLHLASFQAPHHLNQKLRVMIQAQRLPSR